jgi:hypothetical protein
VDLYGLVGDGLVVMYGLVDLCSYSDVIYMCYVSAGCDIVIYIYMSMWKAKKKTYSDLFAERGRRQRALCRVLLAITLGNSRNKFSQLGCS